MLIPKGWDPRFHVPFAQNVEGSPGEGIAIDRTNNRIYVTSGTSLGLVTVIGDHDTVCSGVFPAAGPDESDQITFDIYEETVTRGDINKDGQIDIYDLAYVASRYGSSDATADLTGDGVVDVADLTIITGRYDRNLRRFER